MLQTVANGFVEEYNALDNTIEVGADATEAYERGKVDINFFAGLALPEVAVYALPYFYVACFQLFVTRSPANAGKILRFALGLPRGHAKTTFIKIILAWLIVYDKMKFILIACATEGNAQNIVEDVSNMLGSANMEAVYGKWTDNLFVDNNETKKSLYHGKVVTIEGKGAGSAVRGVNKNHNRPDCIVCDDLQTKENDDSITDSGKLMNWMVGTLMKALAPRRAGDRLVLYIGNMYSDRCILKQLQDSPQWISLITGAILEDGQPLWPELHSIEDLMESYLHDEGLGKADIWFSEVMNDPRSAATSLIIEPLPVWSKEIVEPDGVFLTIDPAGYRKTSDDNVIVVHKIFDSIGIVAKTLSGKFNPKETVMNALALAIDYGASVIGVETTAYQQSLKFWFEYFIIEMEIKGIEVVELGSHGRSKESRIRAFVQCCYEKTYYHETEEERSAFTFQAMKYRIGSKNNKDDLLDATAYGEDMRQEYWHLIRNNNIIKDTRHVGVVGNNTSF